MKAFRPLRTLVALVLVSAPALAQAAEYHCNGQTKQSGSYLYHASGKNFKSGEYLYHANGQNLKSGEYFYHANGQNLKSGEYLYHANGQNLKSGSYYYYANGQNLKSGSYCYYENGNSMGSCPSTVSFPETIHEGISTSITVNLTSGEITEFRNTVIGSDYTEVYSVSIPSGDITEFSSSCRDSNDNRVDLEAVRQALNAYRMMNDASRSAVRAEVCQ